MWCQLQLYCIQQCICATTRSDILLSCIALCSGWVAILKCIIVIYCSIPLDSTVTAIPSTVLNVFPYNMFILTCSVVVYPTTTPIVTYQWTGNNVPMINTSSVSVLSNTVGSSYYQCNVTVTVSLLNTVISSSTAEVTVKGTWENIQENLC